MTSNLGSDVIRQNLEELNGQNDEQILDATRTQVMNLLKNTIRPEFLNRIDETVMFTPLSESQIAEVVEIQMNVINKSLKEQGLQIRLTPEAVKWVAHKGYDPQFGARPVKRVIQKQILNTLATEIISGRIGKKPEILARVDGDKIVFE